MFSAGYNFPCSSKQLSSRFSGFAAGTERYQYDNDKPTSLYPENRYDHVASCTAFRKWKEEGADKIHWRGQAPRKLNAKSRSSVYENHHLLPSPTSFFVSAKSNFLSITQMKISVLINNYNYARFIDECLDSVQRQTHPADEVIVVDDGSTDDSVKRIKAHSQNVICIEKENGGQYSAMQAAIGVATGDVFCFLDSDDTWKPEYLKKVCAAFQSHQQPDFVYTSLEIFGKARGPHILNCKKKRPQFIPKSQQLLLVSKVFLGGPTSANSIKAPFARRLFENKSPDRLEDYRISADRILVFGSSIIDCSKLQLPEQVVNYRVHGSNGYYNKEIDDAERVKAYSSYKRLVNELSNEFAVTLNQSHLHEEFQVVLNSGNLEVLTS